MQIFIHNVGMKGADSDFPKTVFGKVRIDLIEKNLDESIRDEIISTLWELFPEGTCNCWGVPAGALSVINKLQIGDAFLLMRTISDEGEIPALGIIQAFWKDQMLELSNALWGSTRFPYIFFFETKSINLTWTEFKTQVGYSPNYRMPGLVARVKTDRLNNFSEEDYIKSLIERDEYGDPSENYIFESYLEGNKNQKFVTLYERNPELRTKALEIHGYSCKVCEFNFENVYGLYGKGFIHVHHLKPISESDGPQVVNPKTDLTVLCPNCHAMVHRYKNKTLSLEDLRELISATNAE